MSPYEFIVLFETPYTGDDGVPEKKLRLTKVTTSQDYSTNTITRDTVLRRSSGYEIKTQYVRQKLLLCSHTGNGQGQGKKYFLVIMKMRLNSWAPVLTNTIF